MATVLEKPRSAAMPKKLKRDPSVSPGIVCYAERKKLLSLKEKKTTFIFRFLVAKHKTLKFRRTL